MEPKRSLFAVIKTDAQKEKIILENILIMLSHRIYFVNNQKKPLLKKPISTDHIEKNDNATWVFVTDNEEKWAVKIFFHKVQISSKNTLISDFLKEYARFNKIIVAKDFNNKTEDLLTKENTQIFKEASLLQDIISYRDQPNFELLSEEEMSQFKLEYNATDYTTKKLMRRDPVVKYFALRKGDIIRIIRPSPTSGEAIDYRIVS